MFVIKDLFETRYQGAQVIFLAGSVVRGEASNYSDIDLVIVYPRVEKAYRECFYHRGWPVEAFIHDPETLKYFFDDVDRPIGRATLAEMVFEGYEFPSSSELTSQLKTLASEFLKQGPPPLSRDEIDERRFHISGLIDDLREPRNRFELVAAATLLYNELADFYFRSNCGWTGSGKAILKRLKAVNPGLSRRFADAFESLFAKGETAPVIELAEEILGTQGGLLFEGYRQEFEPSVRT